MLISNSEEKSPHNATRTLLREHPFLESNRKEIQRELESLIPKSTLLIEHAN